MEIGLDDLRTPYDLIVVGSGPAGLSCAHKYGDITDKRTLVIESGPRSNAANDAQKLSAVDATGDLSSFHYTKHNQRVFGGTSTLWNGWCAVLEKRAFLNDEWPFPYDELYRYYPEAADILSVPATVHETPETPFPNSSNIVYRPYYFSPPTRFNVAFDDWVDTNENVDVLFNHSVVSINLNGNAASSILVLKSSEKRTTPVEISGNAIVLAGGGVQNARLLHLSLPEDSNLPIGQYFCEHPHIYSYAVLILDESKFKEVEDKHTAKIEHAIALSSEFSNEHSLKSVTFALVGAKGTSHNFLGRSRKAIDARVTVRAEMSSLAENRIALSAVRRDFLNQPIAHVKLKFDLREIHTACEYLNAELVSSGLGRIGVQPAEYMITGGGHLMGSTRMGEDPKTSVTDPHGRVHGTENLYVAGSSLFPSSGAANPTLSIVALSLRLAHHLSGRTK